MKLDANPDANLDREPDAEAASCAAWETIAIADPAAAQQLFSALQRRAQAAGVALRTPPPQPSSCCGRGCQGCVWEGFYSAVAYWREEALLALAN